MSSAEWREPFEHVHVCRNGRVVTAQRLLFGAGAVGIWPRIGSPWAHRVTHFTYFEQAVTVWETFRDLDRKGLSPGRDRGVVEATDQARPQPMPLSGCTCGGIGDTGAHRVGCMWA